MKKLKIGLALLSALAVTGLMTPQIVSAGPDKPEDNKDAKTQPFHGKIESIDTAAKTFTVNGTMIYVTSDTKLTSGSKAILLSDLKVGDSVHGMTRGTFDGKTEAVTVKVGAHEKDKEDKDTNDRK